ncbi:hypothetical protein LXA43DRAFT_898115 [Ganoderma leucocontextum]|nr:hypothetical protein LXA43DRAFT_898115 [Ganoderma leucocontextum]
MNCQGEVHRHVIALLYPMNGGRSRLIRLSADSPFTEEPGSHIWSEDLHTRRWFSRGSQRRRISALPMDASFVLPTNYSIITSTCSATPPINRYVYDNWGLLVRGHVIIIRHAVRNYMRVTSIHPAERRFIDFVVRRWVPRIYAHSPSY